MLDARENDAMRRTTRRIKYLGSCKVGQQAREGKEEDCISRGTARRTMCRDG